MKKQTNKTKITKQKKKQQKYPSANIYFEVILMIILIPTLVFVLVPVFGAPISKTNKVYEKYYPKCVNNVKVLTDKNIYSLNDEIVLIVKNNSGEPVYFEPCEYLNKFEKKIDGKWRKTSSYEGIKVYDEFGFKRENNVTNCEIELPKEGVGIYRTVVRIYYECERPGENMCGSSKTFYSNEFEVE